MRKIFFVTIMTLSFQTPTYAHEGHDKTPGAVAAPHGGVTQGTSQLYLELVKESEGVKIYPLTHDLKPISTKDITLQGSVTFPKNKKQEKVTFTNGDDSFATKIAAKGAYRYALEISVTYKGKKEVVTFQVEP